MATRDTDTLRVVTQVVLGVHVGLLSLGILLKRCFKYEVNIYPMEIKNEPDTDDGQPISAEIVFDTGFVTPPSIIDPIWIFTLAWVPYLLGAWFMTVAVFHDSLQHPGPNAEDPPDALYVIIVTQFLFFSCFAGAQIWYLWNPSQQRYLDTEFYFCLLSLVSKTALAWSLYSGATGRKELGLRAPGAGDAEVPGLALPSC